MASLSAVAASELPPPRPAATGMCFQIRACQRGSLSAASARRSSARRTSVSSAKPSTAELGRRLDRDAVGQVDPLEDGGDLVPAVVAERADDERQVQLRGRGRTVHAGRASARATNSGGASSSARAAGSRAIVAQRLGCLARALRSRRARRSSRAACAGGRRRRSRAASRGRSRAAAHAGGRRRGPSPRSAAAGRRCARPGGTGALRGELHEHRDRAVGLRRGLGEEAVGDLALHHHAPELDARQAVEALRRSAAWRCCRAGSRRASSALGSRLARSSRSASPKWRSTFSRAPSASRRRGSSERSSSTA